MCLWELRLLFQDASQSTISLFLYQRTKQKKLGATLNHVAFTWSINEELFSWWVSSVSSYAVSHSLLEQKYLVDCATFLFRKCFVKPPQRHLPWVASMVVIGIADMLLGEWSSEENDLLFPMSLWSVMRTEWIKGKMYVKRSFVQVVFW